jgi:putative phosphonate metabolism protein
MNRYAIYYTPPPGPFAEFGGAWLGWDPATGTVPEPVKVEGLPLPRDRITETPRKYGLHATLKAPFRLADGQNADGLQKALAAFCAAHAPATGTGLGITRIGRFLALVPEGDSAGIDALAASIVETFDRFRAPMTEAERARRRPDTLTASLRANLDRWGYPYVMDAFRFHITLTGPLPPEAAAEVETALDLRLQPILPRPFAIDALTLCGEAADGRFHAIARIPLSG